MEQDVGFGTLLPGGWRVVNMLPAPVAADAEKELWCFDCERPLMPGSVVVWMTNLHDDEKQTLDTGCAQRRLSVPGGYSR